MADEARAAENTQIEETPSPQRRFDVKRLLNVRSIVAIVVVALVIQISMLWAFSARSRLSSHSAAAEIALGRYEFVADRPQTKGIVRAEFDLHISLLSELDRAARKQLDARRYKVQQGIEELLRQAHGADFEDPTLAELKRQLQELINQNLGLRAVSEVIITDFDVERAPGQDVADRGAREESRPQLAGS